MALTPQDESVFKEIASWWRQNRHSLKAKLINRQAQIVQKQVVKVGKAASAITAGSTGTVNIWKEGVVTDPLETVTAHLDWMHGSQDISSGKEVLIAWFQDEQLWRIIGAECE